MRSSLGRSRSSSSSRSPGATEYALAHPPFPYPHARPPLVRKASSDKEHVTIAPIAPTLLKTTGVGNHYIVTDLSGRERTTPPVDLVYVPSFGGGYALPRKNSGGEGSSSDDVYRHKGSRFSSSPGTSTSTSASSNSRSPPPTIPAAEALPIPGVSSPPTIESPTGTHDEPYDYFGSAATAQVLIEDFFANMRQSDSGADFGPETGALGVRLGRAVDMPEVVVNDETGAIEERCESRPRSRSRSRSRSYSRSHSRTPSPAETKMSGESDTTRMRSTSPTYSSPPRLSLPQNATHLSPTDSYPSRGRTPPGMPPRSWSFSNDGHTPGESCRGRSVTRNSSFSDRERSSSRASSVGGTGSPLGSVSPAGTRAGPVSNGIYSMYAQGLNGVRLVNGSAEGMGSRERGRSGADRRVGVSETSISPPRTAYEGRSLDATIADVSPTSPPVPSTSTLVSPVLPSVTSSGPSPLTLPPQQPSSPAHSISSNPTLSIPIPNVSRPTTEEDRHSRVSPRTHSPSFLRHVSVAVPAPPTSAPASVLAQKPQSPALAPTARDSLTPPESPTEHGTLVGRASEIVSTARGLFGVLWSGNSGNSPGVP
jgi:hypothetical protein